ncbi:MAG: T9SS type A sorting domain-containing protein, partial [bacterium]
GDYIFSIPPAWAEIYTPNMYVATGRFRDGGQGSMGPSIIAYGPWARGNPPDSGSTLFCTPLLLYGNVYQENPHTMNNYHHSDQWSGGVWLTFQDKSAVIFVGTKGEGDCWYGYADGTQWPNDQNREGPGERGWWSDSFAGQFLFYDTEELTAVVQGEKEPWEPQPYATLNIDDCLYHLESEQQWYHLGAAACDREHGLLYVMEPLADDYKSIIHVWQVNTTPTAVKKPTHPESFSLKQNYPNPFNPRTTIEYEISKPDKVKVTIFSLSGQRIRTLEHQHRSAGMHTVVWNGRNDAGIKVGSGVYIVQLRNSAFTDQKKIVILK